MSSLLQLLVVVIVVAFAALYAGRHVWKQSRVADPDFSGTTSVSCKSCPANPSDRAPRNQG